MISFKPYLNQNYELIKENCLSKKQLFEDETFPADETSIWKVNKIDCSNIRWKRPSEFIYNPQFIVNDIHPSDLNQGQIGNCWFISAAVSISTIPEYVKRIIPTDQSFHKYEYAGIFRFRFWHFGEWVEVVVDDRLPVDSKNNLIYCYNQVDKNELFGSLLEKAYAKLNQCYEFLIGGNLIDALIDMTGGVHETFKLRELVQADDLDKENQKNGENNLVQLLWEVVFKSFVMKSLSGAVIKPTDKKTNIRQNKLIPGHSYCIIEPIEILFDKSQYSKLRLTIDEKIENRKSIKLLKMRNPWGEDSWNGKWSRSSDDWNLLTKKLRYKLFNEYKMRGLFYIKFEDFLEYFDELYFVHTNLNAFHRLTKNYHRSRLNWVSKNFHGTWDIKNNTAGGCGNDDRDSFWTNPKYLIEIPQFRSTAINQVVFIISLIQTEQIRKRFERDGTYENSNEPIAFSIYNIQEESIVNSLKNSKDVYLSDNVCSLVYSSGTYLYGREVTKVINLNHGYYLLIPSLFDKNISSKYFLRIFLISTSTARFKLFDCNKFEENNFDSYYTESYISNFSGYNFQGNNSLSNDSFQYLQSFDSGIFNIDSNEKVSNKSSESEESKHSSDTDIKNSVDKYQTEKIPELSNENNTNEKIENLHSDSENFESDLNDHIKKKLTIQNHSERGSYIENQIESEFSFYKNENENADIEIDKNNVTTKFEDEISRDILSPKQIIIKSKYCVVL